jgi:hypothetical protein
MINFILGFVIGTTTLTLFVVWRIGLFQLFVPPWFLFDPSVWDEDL